MRLTPEEMEVMVSVRDSLARDINRVFICIEIMDYTKRANAAELRLWKNRLYFWRRYDISDKWDKRRQKLISAISFGLRMHPTMGEWLHAETYSRNINFPANLNNAGLYTQVRLAWLDKIIETGRIQ